MPTSPLTAYRPGSSWRRTSLLATLFLVLFFLGGSSTLVLAGPPSVTSYAVYDRDVATILAQVTAPTLEYELNGLTGERPVVLSGSAYTIESRKTTDTEAIAMATQYAYEQFVSFGLDTAFQYYTWTGDTGEGRYYTGRRARGVEHTSRNIVAEKPGLVDPQRIYLLTAHIDSVASGSRAPGADDNASGSVAVLTTARLLAPHDLAYTIRFVLFTGEEQGMQGSAAYAAACAAQEQDVRGVINLDMIAYNSDPAPIIDLHATSDVPASLALTRDFATMIRVYDLDLVPNRLSDRVTAYRSDQSSFLEWGYPAMLAIEDWDDFNPHYHKASERVSALDLDYYADSTRAAIATIAYLAVLIR